MLILEERRVDLVDLTFLGKVFEEERQRLLAVVEARLPRTLRDRVDADAILSDAFVRARMRWDAFQRDYDHLRPDERPYGEWLTGLVRDALIDAYRHHTAQKRNLHRNVPFPDGSGSQLLLGIVNPATSPSSALERAEQEERLATVIAELKESDRLLLQLRYPEERSWAEVAALMGLTEANVRQKHFRVLRRLKDLWKQRYGSV